MEFKQLSELPELPDGNYPIPGINPVYHLIVENNQSERLLNTSTGKILKGHASQDGYNYPQVVIRTEDKKKKICSFGRLTLAVRTGVEYDKLHKVRFFVARSGLPRNYSDRKPDQTVIGIISEIEKTLDLIKNLHNGNSLPLYNALYEIREDVVSYIRHRWGWKMSSIEQAIPLAEERLYNQMLNLNVHSIKKLKTWYLNCMKTILLNIYDENKRYETIQ